MLTVKNKKGDRPLEKGITEWEKKKKMNTWGEFCRLEEF